MIWQNCQYGSYAYGWLMTVSISEISIWERLVLWEKNKRDWQWVKEQEAKKEKKSNREKGRTIVQKRKSKRESSRRRFGICPDWPVRVDRASSDSYWFTSPHIPSATWQCNYSCCQGTATHSIPMVLDCDLRIKQTEQCHSQTKGGQSTAGQLGNPNRRAGWQVTMLSSSLGQRHLELGPTMTGSRRGP